MSYSAGPVLQFLLLALLIPRFSLSYQTVYFTMDSYTTTVPYDLPEDEPIVQLYTRIPPHNNASFVLKINRTSCDAQDGERKDSLGSGERELQQIFFTEEETGRIFFQQPVGARRNLTGCNVTLDILAWRRTREDRFGPTAKARVRIGIVSSPPSCSCFGETRYSFLLKSDAKNGAFGTLRSDPRCLSTNDAYVKYSLSSGNDTEWFELDNRTTEVALNRAANVSIKSTNVTVECVTESTSVNGDVNQPEVATLLIRVERDPDYVVIVKQHRSKGTRIVWIHTTNPLVKRWQAVNVSMVGDRSFYQFSAATAPSFQVDTLLPHSKLIGEISLRRKLPRTFQDTHILTVYMRNGGGNSTNDSEATNHVIRIVVQVIIYALETDHSSELYFTIFRNSSRYYRVTALQKPSNLPPEANLVESSVELSSGDGVIQIENSSLLVFIGDTKSLVTQSLKAITAVIRGVFGWEDNRFAMEWTLHIEIIGNRSEVEGEECSTATCSRFEARQSCVAGCGIGSGNGRCKWRQQENAEARTLNFSTCSPDFATCPDRECDGLEQQHPRLCPQDCVSSAGMVVNDFEMRYNDRSGVGILEAIGPVACERDGLVCNVYGTTVRNRPKPPKTQHVQTKPAVPDEEVPYSNSITAAAPRYVASQPASTDCTNCDNLIPLVPVLALIVIVLAVVGYVRGRSCLPFRRPVSAQNYKPPVIIDSSDSRLNSVLSECSDDGLHLSKSSLNRLKTEFDPKWEFPRRNLVLDKVLGEGEFGRVVRAQALSIRGHTGYTTVAVKMLKGSYSCDDLQDLITEMNLLKDLNHPNVVKLLGASTQRGPLYVIVEYCCHGCLRDFLRRNRHTTAHQDDDCSMKDYIHNEEGEGNIVWNNRDLLSFAWQICKGMQYLAMLKLVHRDLAARNILVAEGMVVKVSDFGLTRDLYQSGTYVKTSKSRIPMKWMAPESLFDNVYTTKTDIWSFGVLFWEIVTMGAMPYPGITSHKLCQLIRQGYRLERPEGCADEVYAIMQQCWFNDPKDRPDFDMVGAMLERIMEKDTDYLDLSCLPFGDCSDDEQSNDGPSNEQTSSAIPLLQMPSHESLEVLPLTVSIKKDSRDMLEEQNLKEIIIEETNVDSGPLYGDMDPCRLYSNVNNNFITDPVCKTVSEPNLSSPGIF